MEKDKSQNNHDIAIALMQKDIEYIKNSANKIENSMNMFERNFAKKEEMREIEKSIDELTKNTIESLEKKVDKEVFEPIQKGIQKLNWIVISAIVVGLLAVIIK